MRNDDSKEWLEFKDLQGGNCHAFSNYPGIRFTNQNPIQEEIKSRVKVRECLISLGAESIVF